MRICPVMVELDLVFKVTWLFISKQEEIEETQIRLDKLTYIIHFMKDCAFGNVSENSNASEMYCK